AAALGAEAREEAGTAQVHDQGPAHPARDKGMGAGGTGTATFSQAVQSVARPGASRIAARAMPTSERRCALQPSATRMRPLTAASSRKSIESANRDTDPIASATANSTPK